VERRYLRRASKNSETFSNIATQVLKSDQINARRTKSSARDRLLDTAGRLFQRYGLQGVGIDRILAESGVAKMKLYKHFASKDEMMAAYLERADSQFWAWAESAMRGSVTSEAKLLAWFDAVEKLASSPECLGCVFQGAAMALADSEHAGRRVAIRRKKAVRDRLTDLARRAKLRSPDELASHLAPLMDGAWIAIRIFRQRDNPATGVASAAIALIQIHGSKVQ
jgi:AcrR family transcriptional regulator